MCSGSATMHRIEHVLDGDPVPELRQRVERAVRVVLHRDRGELLAGRAVALHVRARDHGVEAGERHAVERLVVLVGGRRERGGARVAGQVGHLLDAHRQHDVAQAAGDLDEGRPHRQPARGAGRFDARRRDRPQARGSPRPGSPGAPARRTGRSTCSRRTSSPRGPRPRRRSPASPASTIRSRSDFSHSSPNRVIPIPIIATSRIVRHSTFQYRKRRSILFARDLAAEPRVARVVELHGRLRQDLLDRRRRGCGPRRSGP